MNQILNTTWRSISKIAYSNQATILTIFIFFDLISSLLLVSEYLLDPNTQYQKLHEPKSCAEHTHFNIKYVTKSFICGILPSKFCKLNDPNWYNKLSYF